MKKAMSDKTGPFQACIDYARKYTANDFIATEVYGGVEGLTHHKHAEAMAKIPELAGEGLVVIAPYLIQVLPLAKNAEEATAGMARIAEILIQHGIIRLKRNKVRGIEEVPELCRLAPSWDERPWSEIAAKTPVYIRDLRKIFGLPAFATHCIGLAKAPDGTLHSIHGVSGKEDAKTKYDFCFGGNTPAHLSSNEGLAEEGRQETGGIIALDNQLRFHLAGIAYQAQPFVKSMIHTNHQTNSSIRIGHRRLFLAYLPFGAEKLMKADGDEILRFESLPLAEVLEAWHSGDPGSKYALSRFKHTVPMAMISMLIQRPVLPLPNTDKVELNKKLFEVPALRGRRAGVRQIAQPQLAAET
jgi:hypothetical protein